LAFWALAPPADPVAVVFAPLSPEDIEDIHPAVMSDRMQAAVKTKIFFRFMRIIPYRLKI
jgi:hypothetical protein